MTSLHIPNLGLLNEPLPLTPYYMLRPIAYSFDWNTCFAPVSEGGWYLVVFRSKHRHDADKKFLTLLDTQASQVARQTTGFLFYFIGTPLASGECLSFCLWENQAAARTAGAHPKHRQAVEQGLRFYEYYQLERHLIEKSAGQVIFKSL